MCIKIDPENLHDLLRSVIKCMSSLTEKGQRLTNSSMCLYSFCYIRQHSRINARLRHV